MDAVKFVMESERMCEVCNDNYNCMCPIVKEFKICKLKSSDEKEAKKIVEVVETWSKNNPLIVLTEDQETAIRGRIAEGYLWAARDKSWENVCFYLEKPYISEYEDNTFKADSGYSSSKSSLYDFITFENSPVYLPSLIVEYGNNN